MRCYEEAVEVVEGREGPERFRWRGRLLLVGEVLSRWVETGAWWDTPLVRAVRGDDLVTERGRTADRGRTHEGRGDEVDLLAEHEVWRVVARPAAGMPADQPGGIYELDRSCGTGSWRLRAVVD